MPHGEPRYEIQRIHLDPGELEADGDVYQLPRGWEPLSSQVRLNGAVEIVIVRQVNA